MDLKAIAMGLAFAAMWSSAFTSARIAVAYAPPFLILGFRFVISGVVAILLARALGQSARLSRQQWVAVVLFGLLQNGVYLGLIFVAMQRLEASVAVIIASSLPLIVAAISRLAFSERLSPLALAGMAAGLAGVLMVMQSRLSGGADLAGIGLCVIAVLALAIATLLVRGTSGGSNVLMVVGLQMLVGSAVLFPVSLALETWAVDWQWPLVLSFAYTTIVPGLLATVVWFNLVGRIGATRAATFHFLNPFLGVAIAALVLGETLAAADLAGVAVIMAGILAVQLARPPAPVRDAT